MEPTSKRITETHDIIDKVRTQNDLLNRRIDELEFILHKSHRSNTLYLDLENRVSHMEDKMKDYRFEISKRVENIHFQVNTYSEKHNALEQNLDMLNGR